MPHDRQIVMHEEVRRGPAIPAGPRAGLTDAGLHGERRVRDGSSRISSFGSSASARATPMRVSLPAGELVRVAVPVLGFSPTNRSSSSTSVRPRCAPAMCRGPFSGSATMSLTGIFGLRDAYVGPGRRPADPRRTGRISSASAGSASPPLEAHGARGRPVQLQDRRARRPTCRQPDSPTTPSVSPAVERQVDRARAAWTYPTCAAGARRT